MKNVKQKLIKGLSINRFHLVLAAKILTPAPLLLSNLSLNEPSELTSCALIGLGGNNKKPDQTLSSSSTSSS